MPKDYYKEKQYYREKETYREKDIRDKDMYREREVREKDIYREKEIYREKDPYREREHYREREVYRDNAYRESARPKDVYREKEVYKDKDVQRERDIYVTRDRQYKYSEPERKRMENDRIESRLRLLADDGRPNQNSEKENRDKTSGDKELEDLRSRLLSKRITKELQSQDTKKHAQYDRDTKKHVEYERDKNSDRHSSSLDKHQQERRKRLLEAGLCYTFLLQIILNHIYLFFLYMIFD